MGKKNKGKRRLSGSEAGNSKKPATNCYIHSIKVARVPGAVDNNCKELGFKNWPTVITDGDDTDTDDSDDEDDFRDHIDEDDSDDGSDEDMGRDDSDH